MRVPALDPLDVARDLAQHGTAPRDLGRVHCTISETGIGGGRAPN
jgi:hypothetical protein